MPALIVREYLRVSKDEKFGASPDQQHQENQAAFERQGFVVHHSPAYRDVDRSASRYSRSSREDFTQLIADLETGQFGADVLALWESSRGSRKVSEWAHLIELCHQKQIRIWVTTHGRLYDPRNARDRRSLHEDAVDAEYESDKSSERIRRDVRHAATQGKPHGMNIYGYRRVYDQQTRELLRVEFDEPYAQVVRDAAQMILDGMTPYAVAGVLNERGTPPRLPPRRPNQSPTGWTPAAVRAMLTMPAYAGKRQHRGEVIADAVWPALFEPHVWERLQELLRPRAPGRNPTWQSPSLLTGIAICGVCGSPLRSRTQRVGVAGASDSPQTYPSYICRGTPGSSGSHVSIKTNDLDEIVVEHFLRRLRDPALADALLAKDDQFTRERGELRQELEQLRAYLDEVRARAEQAGRADLFDDQSARVHPRIDQVQARLDVLSGVDPLVLALMRAGASDGSWAALDLTTQRQLIRGVMSPAVHRIDRAVRGIRAKNFQRVDPGWL